MHRKTACLDNVEAVTEDLRECVSAMRSMGAKTTGALDKVAKFWRVQPRRVITLFYRNQSINIAPEERRTLALRAAEMLDVIADQQEEKAAAHRAKAEQIRFRERQQLILPMWSVKEWHGSMRLKQRHLA